MKEDLAKLAEAIAQAGRQGVQVERMWEQKLREERKQALKKAS